MSDIPTMPYEFEQKELLTPSEISQEERAKHIYKGLAHMEQKEKERKEAEHAARFDPSLFTSISQQQPRPETFKEMIEESYGPKYKVKQEVLIPSVETADAMKIIDANLLLPDDEKKKIKADFTKVIDAYIPLSKALSKGIKTEEDVKKLLEQGQMISHLSLQKGTPHDPIRLYVEILKLSHNRKIALQDRYEITKDIEELTKHGFNAESAAQLVRKIMRLRTKVLERAYEKKHPRGKIVSRTKEMEFVRGLKIPEEEEKEPKAPKVSKKPIDFKYKKK